MPACGSRLAIAIDSALVTSAAVWLESVPPHDSPGERIEGYRAAHLVFIGAVLGDIGDPQTIRRLTGGHPLH